MVYTKKRKAADSDYDMLTGGSGDVNPQYFTMQLNTQVTNDAGLPVAYALPIPRLKTVQDKQLVMECLQMKFMFQGQSVVAGADTEYYVAITTNPSVTPSTGIVTMQSDPRTLADHCFTILGAAAITPAVTVQDQERYVDMTDGAGHGVLLATDQLYFFLTTAGTGAHTFEAGGKLLFRFKAVDLQDYIGIVQGQQ